MSVAHKGDHIGKALDAAFLYKLKVFPDCMFGYLPVPECYPVTQKPYSESGSQIMLKHMKKQFVCMECISQDIKIDAKNIPAYNKVFIPCIIF